MGTPQRDSDRTDLLLLENIVRHHNAIGTAALSEESGMSVDRICALFKNYFCSVSWDATPGGLSIGELWTYTPTMADKAAERECREQENLLERQKNQIKVPPF